MRMCRETEARKNLVWKIVKRLGTVFNGNCFRRNDCPASSRVCSSPRHATRLKTWTITRSLSLLLSSFMGNQWSIYRYTVGKFCFSSVSTVKMSEIFEKCFISQSTCKVLTTNQFRNDISHNNELTIWKFDDFVKTVSFRVRSYSIWRHRDGLTLFTLKCVVSFILSKYMRLLVIGMNKDRDRDRH